MAPEVEPALSIAFLVDLHWTPERELRLPPLEAIDLVLLGGDLTDFRGSSVAAEVLERARTAVPDVLAVGGNCDLPEVEELFEREGVALDGRAVTYRGVRILGLSGGLPFGACPYERTEAEYQRCCTELWLEADKVPSAGPTILVSHQPPHGTSCDLAHGRHVGSTAIRSSIEQHQPELVLSGHIHEARGCDSVGKSLIVNPGPWFRGGWARIEVRGDSVSVELEPATADPARA